VICCYTEDRCNDIRCAVGSIRRQTPPAIGIVVVVDHDVAFLDDAEAHPEWLIRLADEYADLAVAGVGGSIEPDWDEGAPPWFPPEFGGVVGCSYTG
jgi:hypothetical protein